MSNPNNNNHENPDNNDANVNESAPNNPCVPAAVESALGVILDERLAFANQTVANAATNTTTGASAVGSANQTGSTAPATAAPLPGAPLMGTQCPNCAFLIPAQQQPDERWYAVLVGRRIGFIKAWHRANALTSGVSGERKLYCANEDTARRLFHEAQLTGQTRVVTDGTAVTFTYAYQEGVLFG